MSSTDIIEPSLTSFSIRDNVFFNMELTYSILEDDNLSEIKDGQVFPEKAIISEKSKSWVNITRSFFMAVSTIVLSEVSGGSISLTRTTSWPWS